MRAENLRYRIDFVGRRLYKRKDSVTRRLEIIENHYRYPIEEKAVPFHEIRVTVYYRIGESKERITAIPAPLWLSLVGRGSAKEGEAK